MLGFKCFQTAAVTISGIKLAAKIRKRQVKVGKLQGRPQTIPAIWQPRSPHNYDTGSEIPAHRGTFAPVSE